MASYDPTELSAIHSGMENLEASPAFSQSTRLLRLMRHLLDASLKSEENRLNQTSIAIDVFDRDEQFDPSVDSVVRVEAGRLRGKLREYYESDGKDDPVRFELPKGKYMLKAHFMSAPPTSATDGPDRTEPKTENRQPNQLLSVAVLPFESLSNREGDESLADTVAMEIIDQLGRSTIFRTISRRSTFAYKGKYEDVRQIAKTLAVDYVLEGTLRRSGDRLRFSIALVDGQSGQQAWSEIYDFEDGDTLTLETELAVQFVAALTSSSWKISAGSQPNSSGRDAISQQSLKLIFNFSRHNCRLGKKYALETIAHNPDSAESHGVLAFHLMQEYINYWTDDPEPLRLEGLAAANRAIELGSTSYWAQWGAAVAFEWLGEPRRALQIMELARSHHPDDFVLQGFYGHTLLHFGQVKEGLAAIQGAINKGATEQFMPPFHLFAGMAYTMLNQFDKAVIEVAKAVHSMMDSSATNALWYTNALALNGQQKKADKMLLEALRLSPDMNFEHFQKTCLQAFDPPELGEPLFAGLRLLEWPNGLKNE